MAMEDSSDASGNGSPGAEPEGTIEEVVLDHDNKIEYLHTMMQDQQKTLAALVKHLRVGEALVVYRNLPPFVGRMHPLWERNDWKHLEEQSRQAELMCGKLFADGDTRAGVHGHGHGGFIGRIGERLARRGT